MKWGQCGVVRDGGYHEGHPDPYFSNWRSQWKFYFWKMWRPKLHLKNGFSGGKQLCQPTYFTSWNGRSTKSLVSWLWEVFWPCLSRYPQKQRKRSLQRSVTACVRVKLFKTSAQKAIISFPIKRVVLELPCCCSSMISTLEVWAGWEGGSCTRGSKSRIPNDLCNLENESWNGGGGSAGAFT